MVLREELQNTCKASGPIAATPLLLPWACCPAGLLLCAAAALLLQRLLLACMASCLEPAAQGAALAILAGGLGALGDWQVGVSSALQAEGGDGADADCMCSRAGLCQGLIEQAGLCCSSS